MQYQQAIKLETTMAFVFTAYSIAFNNQLVLGVIPLAISSSVARGVGKRINNWTGKQKHIDKHFHYWLLCSQLLQLEKPKQFVQLKKSSLILQTIGHTRYQNCNTAHESEMTLMI